MVSVFIDLLEAFDTVDHAMLVQRLKCCGITGHALDWFINYLSNRTQCVMADGCKSESIYCSLFKW
jgi:methylaspartate ammonia-lyase